MKAKKKKEPTMRATTIHSLKSLVKLLSKKYMTARQIARETGCATSIAHKRLAILGEQGIKFDAREGIRESSVGPCSTAYRVKPNRASKKILTANVRRS